MYNTILFGNKMNTILSSVVMWIESEDVIWSQAQKKTNIIGSYSFMETKMLISKKQKQQILPRAWEGCDRMVSEYMSRKTIDDNNWMFQNN